MPQQAAMDRTSVSVPPRPRSVGAADGVRPFCWGAGGRCHAAARSPEPLAGSSHNDPFGSRPEPGTCLIASIMLSPPGEAPEGRARGVQDTAEKPPSESED